MKKIAIVRLSSLGDIVHSMVVLQFIKRELRDISIDWFTDVEFYDLLEFNKDIDNLISLNIRDIKRGNTSVISQLKRLFFFRKRGYDLVIDMQGLIKSAFVARVISKRVAGFGFRSSKESISSLFYKYRFSIDYSQNIIKRNSYVVSNALGIKDFYDCIGKKKPFLFFGQIHKDRALKILKRALINVIFCCGSSSKERMYPKEKFANIANSLNANIFIPWKDKKEEVIADYICKSAKNAIKLPLLSLNELKALISSCDLLIGNDTGLSHMAWALNIPSVVIFSPLSVSGERNSFKSDINLIVDKKKIAKSIGDIDEDIIIKKAKKLLELKI